MAYPVTLNGRTYTLADFAGTNYVDGFPDALEDFVTQAGNIYTTTSTSSVAIGSGSKTFTVADSGKPYIVGTPLRIADSAAPSTNWIDGIVTSYSGTTLVVDAVAYAGSGTKTAWNINLGGGPIAYTGTLPIAQGGTGGTTAAAARTNIDVYSKGEADSRFLNVSGEASDVTMTGNVTIGDAGTDTLTINSAMSASGTIKLDGNYPVGADNVALGNAALDDGGLTGGNNIAVGSSALSANTSGASNTAVGHATLISNTTGGSNTGIGRDALRNNTTASNNTAVGYQSLYSNTQFSNTAVGYKSMFANTTGGNSVGIGLEVLLNNTTGSDHAALGWRALRTNTTGSYNVALGREALYSNTTASNNTAVGYQAGYSNTTGALNTAVGYQAGYTNTTGQQGTFLGYQAGYLTTGDHNTAIGLQAMRGASGSTAELTTAVGREAGYSLSSGSEGVYVGIRSGFATTTGGANTSVGADAMRFNTTGGNNVALGRQALYSNTTGTGITAVGYQAGYSNTTAAGTTAFGYQAAYSSTTADGVAAFGYNAARVSTGAGNHAFGIEALFSCTTGANNTAVGYLAGRFLTTGSGNTFVGPHVPGTGASGYSMTTGSKNTILGGFSGNQGGLDIRTSSNNIVLSDGDGNPRSHINGNGDMFVQCVTYPNVSGGGGLSVVSYARGTYLQIAHNASGLNSDGFIQFLHGGVSIGQVQQNGTTGVTYATSSDYRLKENVVGLTGATDRLKQLNPSRFNFISEPDRDVDGFLAHEVQAVVPEAVTGTKDEVDADGNPVYQGIDQSKLVPLLTAALQEALTKIEALEARLDAANL